MFAPFLTEQASYFGKLLNRVDTRFLIKIYISRSYNLPLVFTFSTRVFRIMTISSAF